MLDRSEPYCAVVDMARILLPTIEAQGFNGGIARYIQAIKQTFPGNVEVVLFEKIPSYKQLIALYWQRRNDYDQLWIHHILPLGTAAMVVKMLSRKSYVVFLHGLDFDLARQGLMRRGLTKMILKRAKKVVTNSVALASEVAEFMPSVQPLVVYPCVADELVKIAMKNHNVREVKEGKVEFRLLTVARLVERKGHLDVLEAIKNLPNVSYKIVGDGACRRVIEEKIIELGLSSRVTVHSSISNDELVQFYSDADLFVMPAKKTVTDREGFGIVYLEAGLFGLPVIANNTPGVDEAVVDGVTGTLIDGSVAALTKAIEDYMNNEKLGAEQGKQGRERVLSEFTRLGQISKLAELLS